MEIKIECLCGQHFAFDVEPVEGKMPCAIACPSCNEDATAAANDRIAAAQVVIPAKTVAPRITIHRETSAPPAVPTGVQRDRVR